MLLHRFAVLGPANPIGKSFDYNVYDFRKIKQPQRKRAVPKPSADNFRRMVLLMRAGRIFRENPLVRRVKPVCKRRAKLPSMGMAAQYKVKRIAAV